MLFGALKLTEIDSIKMPMFFSAYRSPRKFPGNPVGTCPTRSLTMGSQPSRPELRARQLIECSWCWTTFQNVLQAHRVVPDTSGTFSEPSHNLPSTHTSTLFQRSATTLEKNLQNTTKYLDRYRHMACVVSHGKPKPRISTCLQLDLGSWTWSHVDACSMICSAVVGS